MVLLSSSASTSPFFTSSPTSTLTAETVPEDRTATMTKYYDERLSGYNPAAQPIDYIFYDPENTVALSYDTFLPTRNNEYISDHLPVFAVFTLRK